MSTNVFSTRLSKSSRQRLESFSRAIGKRPAEAGAMLLEEGLRRNEHTFIDFRNSALGRQAFIEGTRLPVWFVVHTARSNDGSVEETAAQLSLPELKVRAALHYAAAYAGEIDTAIADHTAVTEDSLRGLLPGLETVSV